MLKNFTKLITFKYKLSKNSCFEWSDDKLSLKNIRNFKILPSSLLLGIDNQKEIILKNTKKFAEDYKSNNALLWGTRGNGKSTLIKSIFREQSLIYKKLKLIQLKKNNLQNILQLYEILDNFKSLRFIIFIDDLSFEKNSDEYNQIKSLIDGNIIEQPNNIIIYATSNRRHLVSREMIENEKSSAIHTHESVEEKVSLSDRFGIWLGFHNISQNDYINIIKSYGDFFKLNISNKEINDSLIWSKTRGNMTGRTAWQYIIELSANKKIHLDY